MIMHISIQFSLQTSSIGKGNNSYVQREKHGAVLVAGIMPNMNKLYQKLKTFCPHMNIEKA
jgi:hypothetical protein